MTPHGRKAMHGIPYFLFYRIITLKQRKNNLADIHIHLHTHKTCARKIWLNRNYYRYIILNISKLIYNENRRVTVILYKFTKKK